MNPCEHCQSQLLGLVYDVLNEDEQRTCQEHLAGCDPCRAALDKARQQQAIMGWAAKMEFSAVRFAAPSPSASVPTRILPRPRKPMPWGRFAIAASILIVFGAGSLFAYLGWQDRRQQLVLAQNKFNQAQNTLGLFQSQNRADQQRINQEIRAIQEQIQRLTSDWDKETSEVRRTIQKNKVNVYITGPKNLEPGAKNTYEIQMNSPTRDAQPQKLSVRIVNPQDNTVVFEKNDVPNSGKVDINLPPNLPLKQGVNLAMEVRGEMNDGVPIIVSEPVPLVVPLYLTHVATDRPLYRPGEIVRFRSLTLERSSLKPTKQDFNVQFRITAPNGAEIFQASGPALVGYEKDKQPLKGPDGQPIRGIAAGQFQLPPDLAGGEYTLHVVESANRFQPEKRRFLVNRYQAPRLNKELEFTRKSYGAGDEVAVNAKASRVEGGQAGVMRVVATAQVDGQQVHNQQLDTDADGSVKVRFKLPRSIELGRASLSLQFSDGGNTETIVRPIPIVLSKLLVDFYPEGGDLVAGVLNRVYFRAQSTLNKPAELRGRIIDQDGKAVTDVQTLNDDKEAGVNQGLGLFEFTPVAGKRYELKIDSPIGIESQHVLPAAREDGVVLNIPRGVVEDHIEIALGNGSKDRRLQVGVYCRGRLIDNSAVMPVKKGEITRIKLRTSPGASGVYRVTVFEQGAAEDQLMPIAERLIYRRPVEKIDIRLTTDKKVYAPGDKVQVKLQSNREDKALTPAIVMMSVVDLSVLKLADEKTARSMPAHFYLTTEVQKAEDLEYADFLVGTHPKAAVALDLLLGTQGWRRFAEQNPATFVQKHSSEAQRLVMASGQGATQKRDINVLALDKVDAKYAPKCLTLEQQLVDKENDQQQTVVRMQKQLPALQGEVQTAQTTLNQVSSQADQYQQMLVRSVLWLVATLVLIGGFACVLIGIVRIGQPGKGGTGYLATGVSLIAVLIVGGLGAAVFWMSARSADQEMMMAMDMVVREKGAMKGMPADMAAPMPPMMADAKDQAKKMDDGGLEKLMARPGQGVDPMFKVPPPKPGPVAAENVPVPQVPGLPLLIEEARKAEMADPVAGIVLDQAPGGFPDAPMMPPGAGGRGPGRGGFRAMDRLEQMVHHRRALLRAQARMEPFVVREYAHQHQPSSDQVRRDFTETLFWHPVLVLNDGSAEVTFDLSDATTRFQVLAMGHTLDGRLGNSTIEFASRLPFSVEPKVPMEVSSTDKIIIPVTIDNATEQKRNVLLETTAKGLEVTGKSADHIDVDGSKRKRYLFHYKPGVIEGNAVLSFTGKFLPVGVDRVERSFPIVPDGFPVMHAKSDMLEGEARQELTLPESWIKGTLKVQVQAFPSTLADLQTGLEAMLQEPGGCFEQSSSSNYPNVLILNYLKESEQNMPEVEKRARQLLSNGYQRLTSFECIPPSEPAKKRGYEWFGQTAPPHEALTAYGLLQFKDMARVHPVDKDMVERTRQYLLGQRDGKGGFKRNARALDSFGRAPEEITNAYIVWAITEAGGDDDLKTELDALTRLAKNSKDPYFLALVGNALINRSQTKDGIEILTRLVDLQKKEGYLEGQRTSITGSQGRDLQVETTALSILAWLKANRPEFTTAVQKSVKWLGQQRGGHGGFGATQSTILALKALIAHTRTTRAPVESGELKLFIGDAKEPIAIKAFAAKSQEPLIVSVPREDLMKPGKNKLKVEITGKNAFPYTLSWSYRTVKPVNPEAAPVHLTTKLDRNEVKEGETVRMKAIVENKSGNGQGMAVAILGIPAGLALPEDMAQLKEMAKLRENGTKQGPISFFEVRGRELVLYWRDLAPAQKIEVDVDLICRIPGEYRGPASRAYLYYNADHKYWTDPVSVAIRPAE